MTPTKGYAVHSATDTLGPFDFERREVGPHDVQFEILFCGVCHSDIHQVRNEWGNSVYPMVPGHEIVGRVTAVGEHVKKFKTGDLAGVGCLVDSCRECDNCQKGLEQFCRQGATGTYNAEDKKYGGLTYGGYSNQIVVDENYVVKVSDKLDLAAVAPLLCAGITTYSPLKHWKVGPGHKVAVVGLGGLGHMAVKFAAAFGADVTVLSTSPSKEADAAALGAHHFALTKDPEQLPSLASKFDFIVDTVSAPHDYNMYLSMLNTDGVMICVGVPPTPMEVLGFNLLGGRRSIAGSAIGGLPETQEMLDYCAEHNIVSDIELIDMNYISEAYERMLKGDVKYRFVVDMATL
ncbi:MAG: NAD(P)-dependent alcohol dehydrogenase [Janthinobacterium lividum]